MGPAGQSMSLTARNCPICPLQKVEFRKAPAPALAGAERSGGVCFKHSSSCEPQPADFTHSLATRQLVRLQLCQAMIINTHGHISTVSRDQTAAQRPSVHSRGGPLLQSIVPCRPPCQSDTVLTLPGPDTSSSVLGGRRSFILKASFNQKRWLIRSR